MVPLEKELIWSPIGKASLGKTNCAGPHWMGGESTFFSVSARTQKNTDYSFVTRLNSNNDRKEENIISMWKTVQKSHRPRTSNAID